MLVEMTRFESTGQGKLIASQMLDVTIRVKEVRPFSVRQMVRAYIRFFDILVPLVSLLFLHASKRRVRASTNHTCDVEGRWMVDGTCLCICNQIRSQVPYSMEIFVRCNVPLPS